MTKAEKAAYSRRYYQRHREAIIKRVLEYRRLHPEVHLKAGIKYRESHREQIRERMRKYRQRPDVRERDIEGR